MSWRKDCAYPKELVLKVDAGDASEKHRRQGQAHQRLARQSVAIQQKEGRIDSIKCVFQHAGEWNVKRDDATVEEAGKVLARGRSSRCASRGP